MLTPTRRTLLTSLAAAPFAGLVSPARAAGPLKIAYVYPSPIGDAGWAYQHDLGRKAMVAALGDKVSTTYVESVSEEGADAERVIRKFATDGNGLIFTVSFGFMNPTAKVAGQFPKTTFEHCSGYKRAKNLATYSARFYEGRYLSGIVAGGMSKTGVIGYVAAFPIPEVVMGINATLLGARTVNPNATIKVVFISSWFDPGKERAAADTLISQGADLVTHHTDSTAVAQAGEEKGVYTISYNSDMAKYGPKTVLTGVTHVWDRYYIDRVNAVLNGTWKPVDTWGGVGQGMIALAPLNAAVPADLRAKLDAATAKIADGSLKPFSGMIKDQGGATKVAAGASMSDQDIEGMSWFAEGVQGTLG